MAQQYINNAEVKENKFLVCFGSDNVGPILEFTPREHDVDIQMIYPEGKNDIPVTMSYDDWKNQGWKHLFEDGVCSSIIDDEKITMNIQEFGAGFLDVLFKFKMIGCINKKFVSYCRFTKQPSHLQDQKIVVKNLTNNSESRYPVEYMGGEFNDMTQEQYNKILSTGTNIRRLPGNENVNYIYQESDPNYDDEGEEANEEDNNGNIDSRMATEWGDFADSNEKQSRKGL